MIRATYADLKPQIARVAGATGMSTSDPRVMGYVNLATEELMNESDLPPSLINRVRFRVSQRRFVLPSEYDRCLYLTVDGTPIPMQSPWFEFVGYGPDLLTVPGITQLDRSLLNTYLIGVLDREDVATFEDIPSSGGPYYPIITAQFDESVSGVVPSIVLQGYDQNGNWVRSEIDGVMTDGIAVQFATTTPFQTFCPQTFSQVTAIRKPVTKGYIGLSVTNNSPQSNIALCTYAPYDTRPFYREYRIPGLSNDQVYCVVARLSKRYAPIVQENDWLLISNLPAMVSMVQAVYYREAKDFASYAQYKATAVDLIRKEGKKYVGQQRQKPAITFGEGLGTRIDANYIL